VIENHPSKITHNQISVKISKREKSLPQSSKQYQNPTKKIKIPNSSRLTVNLFNPHSSPSISNLHHSQETPVKIPSPEAK